MKMANVRGKTLGETYIIDLNSDYLLTFTCKPEEDVSIFDAFSFENTGIKYPVSKMKQDVDNGDAVWFWVRVSCVNTNTNTAGVDTLGACYDKSIDRWYSSAMGGYYQQLVDAVKHAAGVE